MNKLVKLTEEQIEDIVSILPPCLSASSKIAEKVRTEIQNKLRLQLKDEMLVDNPEAIEKLKNVIKTQHYNSLAIPGEPVGMRAAEAISQPVTQAALNAFHSSGAGGKATIIATGVDAIRELYYVSSERKLELTFLHFKDKNLIFDDIIELRRDLECITVKDLLINNKPEGEELRYNKESEPWWYGFYLTLKKESIPFNTEEEYDENDTRNMFLRLKFDINKLYAYNVTTYEIANKMNLEGIVCIPSPTSIGIVDVFVKSKNALIDVEKKTSSRGKDKGPPLTLNVQNATLLFLQISLQPQLKTIYINGINGLTQISPIPETANVLSIIKSTYEIKSLGVWRIIIDKPKLILSGIPKFKLINTLKICGYQITEENDNYIDVVLNSKPEGALKDEPKVIINFYREKYTKEFEEKEEDYKNRGIKYEYRDIYPEFLRQYNYVYAYAKGANLREILSDYRIDSQRTICNNPHKVLEALGIEAARNFMIKSYNEILEATNNYVNPHHVVLMSDFQTSRGMLIANNARGLARLKPGPFTQASFEQPMEMFIDAAAFGKKEQIRNTSSSIFLGKRMILGTGSFKARLDIDAISKAEAEREAERKENPEVINKFTKSMEKVFNQSLVNDSYLEIYADDTENQNGISGLEGVVAIDSNVFGDLFKYKTIIPEVKKFPENVNLPDFVKNIINNDTLNESGSKIRYSSNIPSFKSDLMNLKGSVSKPGLPALPKISASQLLSLKNLENRSTMDREYSDTFSEV